VSPRVSGHIVITGWNRKAPAILRELHAKEVDDIREIVVLVERAVTLDDPRATILEGNPTQTVDLLRAGLDRANTCIVLADDNNPTANADDIDARTLLTTLAVESTNPNVYTCVEVLRSENRIHFERTKANELIVSSDLSGSLLAAAAVTHGISRVVFDLVTHPAGNEFREMQVPTGLAGLPFIDVMARVKRDYNAIVVAIDHGDGSFDVNPVAEDPVHDGDRRLVIAYTPLAVSS